MTVSDKITITMENSRNFLEFCSDDVEEKFILPNDGKKNNQVTGLTGENKSVLPQPGFCLKTETEEHEKVFINICKSDYLPCPKDISDEEILKLSESENPSDFRLSLSIGEPHVETDKTGKGCTAYDVIINSTFYERLSSRAVLKGFLLTVAVEGLENKYNLKLNRDLKLLKNRKSFGTLQQQIIRSQSKPWIVEVDGDDANKIKKPQLVEETEEKKAPQPVFKIIQEPKEGHPEYLVAEIQLPKVKMASSLMLDIGGDYMVLNTRSNCYHLDICLPFFLDQDSCTAEFDRKTKILTVVMPVYPENHS